MMPIKPFFAYRSFRKELHTVKRFYDAGIRQFCVFPSNTTNSLGQPYVDYPPNWLYFDAYEFEHADRQIDDILSVAPEAELLCMIDLNSPNWLIRLLMRTLADSTIGLTDALTTERWRKETLNYMRALLTHLETTYPGRIKGYILACGMTDEWMDYSKGRELAGKLEAYRQWSRIPSRRSAGGSAPIRRCICAIRKPMPMPYVTGISSVNALQTESAFSRGKRGRLFRVKPPSAHFSAISYS